MDDRVMLNRGEVDKALVAGEAVHTFVQSGCGVLLGCDVSRSKLLDMAEKYGAELAGEAATGMNHGVVVYDGKQPLFCQTA